MQNNALRLRESCSKIREIHEILISTAKAIPNIKIESRVTTPTIIIPRNTV